MGERFDASAPEQGEQHLLSESGGRGLECQGDRCPQEQEWRSDQREDEVLDHVDRQQSIRISIDGRHEGYEQDAQSCEEIAGAMGEGPTTGLASADARPIPVGKPQRPQDHQRERIELPATEHSKYGQRLTGSGRAADRSTPSPSVPSSSGRPFDNGRVRMKVLPFPTSLWTETDPPCASAI